MVRVVILATAILWTVLCGARAQTTPGPFVNGFDVASFGAVCNGTGDDGPAINRALVAAKATTSVMQFQGVRVVFPANKQCRITTTLDMTGQPATNIPFEDVGPIIDGNGSVIFCAVNGAACIDAMGAARITFRNLNIWSENVNTPTIGIQIGRTTWNSPIAGVAHSADSHVFDNVSVQGNFTFSSFYNMGSESVSYNRIFLRNFDTGNSYAVVLDGYNHFKALVPTLAPAGNTIPVDQPVNMNQGLFNRAIIQGAGSGATMWIGGTNGLEFTNLYASTAGAPCMVQLWFAEPDTFRNNNRIVFDAHFEVAPTNFCLVGSGAALNPVLRGFKFINESSSQATNAIFKIDPASGFGFVALHDLQLENTTHIPSAPAQQVFEDGTKWSIVSGEISVTTATQWETSPPVSFSGRLCINGQCGQQLRVLTATAILAITCNAAVAGRMYGVGDANSAVFNAAVASGGTNRMIAYCDGTGWKVR